MLTSWEQVTKELLDLPSFGKQIGKYDEIKAEAREVIAGIGTPEARLAALYAHVQKKLKWNEIHVTFPLRDLRTAFKSGEVDNAEQTMILISMLREAEINAHPVLIKTRNQGAVVTISGKEIALYPNLPPSL